MRIALLLVALLTAGCSRMIAEQMVQAPNRTAMFAHDRSDSPPDELRKEYVDQQLRIDVGPPDATISVWICEPWKGEETFRLHGGGRQVRVDLYRKPSTVPATSPSTAPATPRGTIFLLTGIQDDKTLGPYVLYREMLVH